MHKLHNIDILVIVIYAILCLFVAFRYIGKIKNIKEYAIGGAFSTKVLSATLFATFIGAGTILGYIDKIYEVGLVFAFVIIFEPVMWLMTAQVFSKNIGYFKESGCLSISDIMYVLYGNLGRWLSNILSIILAIGTIAVQIKAIGYLAEYFLGLPEYQGAAIGFVIVVVYSFFGGIRAVVFTDVLQSLVFLVGIPIACVTAYYALGGYTEVINHIPQNHKVIQFNEENIILLISCLIYSFMPITDVAFVQRYLMAKDANQLKKSLYYTFCLTVPFCIIIILTGFITLATVPAHASKLAFYDLITNNLPIGIKGLVIAGILAAIMSTTDSFLNSSSVMFAHNIMKSIFPSISARTELNLAKLATLIISALSLWMAFVGENLVKILWLSENFWAPFMVVPLTAGFLKFYTNSTSFKGSIICAFIFILLGRIIAGEFGIVSIAFGLLGSAIGLFGTHKLQGLSILNKTYDKTGKKFIKRINKFTLRKLYTIIQRDIQSKTYAYYYFGIFGTLFFLLSSLAFDFSNNDGQLTIIWLRLIAVLICTLLSMNELIQSKLFHEKWMPLLWILTLVYCLPFLSTYTLLASNMHFAWIANLIISLVLLFLLVHEIIAVLLLFIGLSSAYLYFKLTGGYTSVYIDNNFIYILIALYGAGATLIFYLLHKREQQYASAITTKLLYSSLIAHETKSPLSSISMIADNISNILSSKKKLTKSEKEIATFLPFLKQISKKSIYDIERTLSNLRLDISEAADFGVYNISECIRIVLNEYGLSENELNRIKVNLDEDFKFQGSKHFMKLIIINLINNFLKYAGQNATLEIFIRDRCLYIKDNGVGIDEDKKTKLFFPFEKGGSITGTGVGLAFCDFAMREIKGSIDVISEKAKGTTFILKFPNI